MLDGKHWNTLSCTGESVTKRVYSSRGMNGFAKMLEGELGKHVVKDLIAFSIWKMWKGCEGSVFLSFPGPA